MVPQRLVTDKRAAFGPRIDKAFGCKAAHGFTHRRAADTQHLAELELGRQRLAGGKITAHERQTKPVMHTQMRVEIGDAKPGLRSLSCDCLVDLVHPLHMLRGFIIYPKSA